MPYEDIYKGLTEEEREKSRRDLLRLRKEFGEKQCRTKLVYIQQSTMEECANVIYIKNRGERIYMNERNIDIEDMQCWVFRMAQTRWKMPAKKCAKLFKEYDIWEFIEECYDILHLNSYNCVLNDIEVLLKNKGVTV